MTAFEQMVTRADIIGLQSKQNVVLSGHITLSSPCDKSVQMISNLTQKRAKKIETLPLIFALTLLFLTCSNAELEIALAHP